MFTGIVEELGRLEKMTKGQNSAVLTIQAKMVLEDLKIGDSIAVNGICLTVTRVSAHHFTADIMHETLNRSAFSLLKCGTYVNLERAMPANGRFGGHIVAGHVDGTGKIVQIRRDDTAVWYQIHAQPKILRYVVEKGSVAVDGISLTVAQVYADGFSVCVIPHTVCVTALTWKRESDLVNLETDIIGKYVDKLRFSTVDQQPRGGITKEFLTRCGV